MNINALGVASTEELIKIFKTSGDILRRRIDRVKTINILKRIYNLEQHILEYITDDSTTQCVTLFSITIIKVVVNRYDDISKQEFGYSIGDLGLFKMMFCDDTCYVNDVKESMLKKIDPEKKLGGSEESLKLKKKLETSLGQSYSFKEKLEEATVVEDLPDDLKQKIQLDLFSRFLMSDDNLTNMLLPKNGQKFLYRRVKNYGH